MDYVSDVESGRANFVNPFELVVWVVRIEFGTNVSEDAIAFSLANVERLAVAWID
jgi:hypothetical protein